MQLYIRPIRSEVHMCNTLLVQTICLCNLYEPGTCIRFPAHRWVDKLGSLYIYKCMIRFKRAA